MNENRILGKKIFIITAHPDDETFTAAGTIFRNNRMGGSTTVVCSTLGEKGKSHLKGEMTEQELGEVRKNELISVLEFLGVSNENVHTYNLPDTAVKNFCNSIEDKILHLVNTAQPDLIMSFDEYGFTGHEDHIAMGVVAQNIASELNLPLVTFTLPPELLKECPEFFQKRQKYGKYVDTVEFKEPNVVVNIDREVKEQALCFHKSQFGDKDPLKSFPKSLVDCVLKNEYFFLGD